MATKIKHSTGQEFVITRDFDAPRELVFKAWTDPKLLARWWGPKGFTNPVCEWDLRPGGKIYDVMRAPNGDEYPMGGEFREIIPPERLVFTSGALGPDGKLLFEFLHDAAFTEHKGKTKLTLRSKITMTTPEASRYTGGFDKGMNSSLDQLTEMLAQKGDPLVFERIFNAPVAQVWKALTDKDAMRQWYFELEKFEPVEGFEFDFDVEHKNMKYCHRCKVTDVIPQKRIAYTWRYEGHPGDSLVTFELYAEGIKTRLKLTHIGLETFPPTESFARKNFQQGWNSLIGSRLMEYVENHDTVDRQIIISRAFDAPRELVWEAMTNPKHVVNWWGPRGFSTTIETMDVRPGGIWKHVMHGPDGSNYPNENHFKEITRPERIVFSLSGKREGGPGTSFVSTWTFEALGHGKTQVTIRMVFPSTADRDFVVKEFNALEGGNQTLDRLGEFLPALAASK